MVCADFILSLLFLKIILTVRGDQKVSLWTNFADMLRSYADNIYRVKSVHADSIKVQNFRSDILHGLGHADSSIALITRHGLQSES